MLNLPMAAAAGAPALHDPQVRRPSSLAIDFVLHGASPTGDWVRAARIGDRIDAAGPRGRTLMCGLPTGICSIGDESCIPAIFAMLEGLARSDRAFVFLEIANDAERQAVESAAAVQIAWLPRNGAPPGPSTHSGRRRRGVRPPAGSRTMPHHRRDPQCPRHSPAPDGTRPWQGPVFGGRLLAPGPRRRPRPHRRALDLVAAASTRVGRGDRGRRGQEVPRSLSGFGDETRAGRDGRRALRLAALAGQAGA